MHFTMYNGLTNCPLGNVKMHQMNAQGGKINEIMFEFNNANTTYMELNDVAQV